MRISDWSSDVCSSDLRTGAVDVRRDREPEMLEIVAGIDDGRYRSRRNGVAEAEHQFRPVDASRQDGDVAAQRNRSSSIGRTSAAAGVSATVDRKSVV